MKKRIVIFSGNFYPEQTGIGVTVTDMALFLQKLGYDVSVVTTMPHYPEWEIHQDYRGKLLCRETFQGINVYRHWLYVPRQATALKRILGELSFCVATGIRALSMRYDEAVIISPPLAVASVTAALIRLRSKPASAYIKDIQPDAAISLGMLQNPLVKAVSKKLERLLYSAVSRVLVLSRGMAENLQAKGVPAAKLEILPDSFSTTEFATKEHDRVDEKADAGGFRKAHNLEDSFLALYSGNLGVKQNPDILLEVALRLPEASGVHIAIVGQGAMQKEIELTLQKSTLKNISLHPLVARENFVAMLRSADVLLAPQRKEVVDIVVPSKLLSYLASGTAVISSADPGSEAAKLLLENDAGVVVEPESAEAIAAAILDLQRDGGRRSLLGANGKKAITELFSHEVVFEKYYRRLFGRQTILDSASGG